MTLSKVEKRIRRIAKYIVRVEPKAELDEAISNKELHYYLQGFFSKSLDNVDRDYLGFCKEVQKYKETYLNWVKKQTKPIAPRIKYWMTIEKSNMVIKFAKRKRKEIEKAVDVFIDYITYFITSNELKRIKRELENAGSKEELLEIISNAVKSWKEKRKEILVNMDNTNLDKAQKIISNADFPLVRETLVKKMEYKYKIMKKEEKAWEFVCSKVKELQKQYNANIDIVELVCLEYGWGIKIAVNGQTYIFEVNGCSLDNLVETIEDVVMEER